MSSDKPIIIIKKVKAAHGGGHHGGAWKVAYADFVTAMMAFFLVMWILGLNQDTRKAIASYFNDPAGLMKSQRGGKDAGLLMRDSVTGKPSIVASKQSVQKEKQEKERIKEVKKAIEKMIATNPRFKSLQKFVDITITREGLRIELLEGHEALFFETGSARLEPHTIALLGHIGREVGRLENSVVVEGHTDARPYAGGMSGYSNWELSTDRANSARRVLCNMVHKGQITEVRGYADSRLRTPADPLHFSNRRISILVPYAHQTDGSATREVGPDDFGDNVKPGGPNFAVEAAMQSDQKP